jgi:hypothetical protein
MAGFFNPVSLVGPNQPLLDPPTAFFCEFISADSVSRQ